MSTTKPQQKSDTFEGTSDELVQTLADKVSRSFTIGTDREGYRHHYYRPADTVVVYDADGVDHRERLEGAPVEHWVAFVEDRRGWASYGPHAALGIAADTGRKEELA